MTLPHYEALINSEEEGIFTISLVADPATGIDWVAFEKQEQPLLFSVQNEEQRMILGCIMRASFPIYRYTPDLGEFYLTYSKDTIKKMAEKLLFDGKQNSVNIMHVPGSDVNDVYMTSIFIKDVEKGINPAGFENVEDGSLFASFHVLNDEVWNEIKNGTFKSFSLEGYFTIDKETKKTENMSLKTEIMNSLIEFKEVETKNGILYWNSEEDLKEGDEVFVGEEKEKAPTGEYETLDGKVIKVEDGKVVEIVDVKAEVAEEEMKEEKEEVKEEMEEETTSETTTETETVEETTDNKDEEIAALKEEVENLKVEVEELKKAIDAINAQLSLPAVPPIEQEFEKTKKNDVKKGKALSILSHLND